MKTRLITLLIFLSFTTVNLVAADGVAWNSLSVDEQNVLNQFKDTWDEMPPQRQQRLQSGAKRWQTMSDEQRQNAKQRMHEHMQSLSEEERRALRQRLKNMSPEQRRNFIQQQRNRSSSDSVRSTDRNRD